MYVLHAADIYDDDGLGELAFSATGWTYNTGETTRTTKLIVQIREPLKLMSPEEALAHLRADATSAGSFWSDRELRTHDVPPAQLAVVVGVALARFQQQQQQRPPCPFSR
jgi:hypothetical protein